MNRHAIKSIIWCRIEKEPRKNAKHDILGLICVFRRTESAQFSELDKSLLRTLAIFAMKAVENARKKKAWSIPDSNRISFRDLLEKNPFWNHTFVAVNPEFRKQLLMAQKVAFSNSPVMLLGRTGAGKEIVANFIHNCSSRSSGKFVGLNISSLSESLIESELFGHVEGAFTGAMKKRDGVFSKAQDGTLFLDDFQNVSMNIQAKLLRVLQEGHYQPVGSDDDPVSTNARIICSFNRDPKDLVAENILKEDLYYRLNTFMIHIPPLRERLEDIEPLVRYFSDKLERKMILDPKLLAFMKAYPWPGNVRELKSVVDWFDKNMDGDTATLEHLPKELAVWGHLLKSEKPKKAAPPKDTLKGLREDSEREFFRIALLKHGRDTKSLLLELGLSKQTYYNKLKKFRLNSGRNAPDAAR